MVRRDDQEWFDVVRWTISALIQAEELGVTSQNAEAMKASPNPDIRRLLGVDPVLGNALKLDPAWAINAIRAIGNYGELFERHLGPKTRDRAGAGVEPALDRWRADVFLADALRTAGRRAGSARSPACKSPGSGPPRQQGRRPPGQRDRRGAVGIQPTPGAGRRLR